jgi:acyl carrier protein
MTERQSVVETITDHVRKVINEAKDQEIDENRDLREFAQYDSLAVLELLVWVESTFGITIPGEDLVVDGFDSVGKIADYVTSRSH